MLVANEHVLSRNDSTVRLGTVTVRAAARSYWAAALALVLAGCSASRTAREEAHGSVDSADASDCCEAVASKPGDDHEAALDADVEVEGAAPSDDDDVDRARCSSPACAARDASAPMPVSTPEGSADANVAGGIADSGLDAGADGGGALLCWQMPVVDRIRLLPAPGKAALLQDGKIEGSDTSAMNGFVELARVTTVPSEGQWLELRVVAPKAYRYVKYHGPAGSFGALAELELYAGAERVSGVGFGTAGARNGADSGFARALDGDTKSFFEGPLADDQYVGFDLAGGYVLAAPTFSASAASSSSQTVRITGPAAAQIRYTLDGSDPATGAVYTDALTLSAGSTLVRAVALGPCMHASEVAQTLYRVGAASKSAQSSMHIGNSLTDTVVPFLQKVAQSGGFTLDFNRYTVPGAGTWVYEQQPNNGFGVANVQEALRTRPFDQLTLQAYPNMPCQALPSADGSDSDSGFMNEMWSDARKENPNVQLWVYQQWPEPRMFSNCLSGGGWTRGGWSPPAPQSWEQAVRNERSYHESVRAELVRLNPSAPPPYIIPAGNALVLLKQQVEAGGVPGVSDFFGQLFLNGGTDIHLTPLGAYYVTLVFYGCMFQRSPEGTSAPADAGVSVEQAAVLQRLAWQAVTSYALSGVQR